MPRVKNRSNSAPHARRVTLKDIAEVAGVHVMTVSDALNDTRSVAPATREKVKRIAREMNYIPNSAARALATGRTGIIAVLSGAMNEPYYGGMAHLIEKHLNSADYKLLLLRTPHEVKDLVSATGNAAVDGAIAIDMYHLVKEFRSRSAVPCVSIGTYAPPFVDHVVIDLRAGVEEAVRLMVSAGRRRIAYLVTREHMALPSEARAGAYLGVLEAGGTGPEARGAAYLGVLDAAGLEPEIINVDTDEFGVARLRFQEYIERRGCPDALLCQNDETAMIAYRVLRDCGYTIPDDVLLVGCDGDRHMEYFDPPLSTIVQPVEEVCQAAWQILQRRMADPSLPRQQATFQGKLVIRPSLLPPGSPL